MRPIPVTIVTGFLGAGKTTLVNAWLRTHERGEVAVIVNEVGAVGVDAELLAERARTIVEIAGGCICCTTYESLVRALDDLAARAPRWQRIVVETSGAASPAGVLRALSRRDGLALDGVVTVVDGSRIERALGSDLALEQLGYADVIVLSRAAGLAQEDVDRVRARSAAAVLARAERGAIVDPAGATVEGLLALRSADPPSIAIVPAPTAHASAIESVALAHAGELDEDRFAEWMESDVAAIAGRLLRIKGVLAMQGVDERVILQGVAGEVEVTLGAPWGDASRASRLVIVGYGLDRAQLAAGFDACAARGERP